MCSPHVDFRQVQYNQGNAGYTNDAGNDERDLVGRGKKRFSIWPEQEARAEGNPLKLYQETLLLWMQPSQQTCYEPLQKAIPKSKKEPGGHEFPHVLDITRED